LKEVSFVMITWNRAPMLKLSIYELAESIEDKQNCEILIYNNCSDDSTKDILQKFEEDYKNKISIRITNGEKNIGLNAYKKLFKQAKGKIIVEVDDDVLSYPINVDKIFITYLSKFKKFGYLALDVIQNEFTTGAKHASSKYTEIRHGDLIVEKGPTGGWCTGFRRKDYQKISFIFNFFGRYNFKHGEDGALQILFRFIGKDSGIIKGKKCFHATGPYYSKHYKLLERDIEKYNDSGRTDLVEKYKNYE